MVINRKEMAKAKVRKIKSGLSAFAETKEVIELIKKELGKENITVHVDETDQGCWFIPENNYEK